MAPDDKPARRCEPVNHPNLQPGWGCCVCRVYNGDQRQECKHCKHKRCDVDPGNRPS